MLCATFHDIETPIGTLTIRPLGRDRIQAHRASWRRFHRGREISEADVILRQGRWQIDPKDAVELPAKTIKAIVECVTAWAAENQTRLDQEETFEIREARWRLRWPTISAVEDMLREHVKRIQKGANEGAFRLEGRDVTGKVLATADKFSKVIDEMWAVHQQGVAIIEGEETEPEAGGQGIRRVAQSKRAA
jgi:hypothetical protein